MLTQGIVGTNCTDPEKCWQVEECRQVMNLGVIVAIK